MHGGRRHGVFVPPSPDFPHETISRTHTRAIAKPFFYVLRSAVVYQYLLQGPSQPSNAVYFDAATVQQQPRFEIFPVTRHEPVFYVCLSVPSNDLTANSRNYESRVRCNFSFFDFAVPCCLLLRCTWYVSPRPPSSARCDCHGATAAAFQGIPFLAATNGVLLRVTVFCSCHSEHNPGDRNPHFL